MRFGTDGIRGVANTELTPEFALRLGQAVGSWLRTRGGQSVVIGRDTRRSGTMLGAALASGLNSTGVDVTALGVAPTPAVSYAARTSTFDLGAVISASHNPAEDNGIKFLGHDGKKLSDEDEREIAAKLESDVARKSHEIGKLETSHEILNEYENWLAELLPERLEGMHVAVDCANGAASEIAPRVLQRLGAEVTIVHAQPDGWNINLHCGATNPSVIQKLTTESGAAVGVSFDGDADRCVFSDELGSLVNGDRLMGIWAHHWRVEPPIVVGTVMSNMGFEAALLRHGIDLQRTNVGDRYVAQRMQETGAKIGGEQSGHIIFADLTPTGDGLLTALQLLRVMRRTGRAVSELEPTFSNWPQLLLNVRVADRGAWQNATDLHEAVEAAQQLLGDAGRVNVRPSGTQPVLRIMVEASDAAERDRVSEALLSKVVARLGGELQGKVDLTHALGD